MLGAIFIGLSGMNAYSKGLQTISNNVANLNTAGYKSTSVTFTDVFNQGGVGSSYFGSGSSQYGNGVRLLGSGVDFGQGDLRPTDNDLDLAIQGGGFLVLLDGANTYFARTGQFAVNEDGFIVDQATGHKLAVLNDERQPVALSVDQHRTNPPVATTSIKFADNLSADLSSNAAGATVSNISVYDSNGGKHIWKVEFTPVGSTAPGEWTVKVTDQSGTVLKTSTLKFIGSVPDPTTSKITVTTTPANAEALEVDLDFSQGVTSYSAGTTSTIRASSVDGRGAGTLTSVTIDDDGQVKLTYSNSETHLMGHVALADFRDPQQLERVGNGLFSNGNGADYRLLTSGEEGVGKLVSKQIEASNVDLSQQFGDLILVQRGFQASSQVVSVSNDMIQQLFGIRGQG